MACRDTNRRPPDSPPNQVWLGSIPRHFQEDDVKTAFERNGLTVPERVDLMQNWHRDEKYGFAFFKNQQEADEIVTKGNTHLQWEEGGKHADVQVGFFCHM